jgi:hypothetical protein
MTNDNTRITAIMENKPSKQSDSKSAAEAAKKPQMDKRKIVKDDGRTLIFYSFGKNQSGQGETN